MIICIDFDGTCVAHEFPKIGKDIGAVPVLKKIIENGHKLILHTMRGSKQALYNGTLVNIDLVRENVDSEIPSVLDDAVKWFEDNNIPLYCVNNNPQQKHWTDSPKVFANLYIDDSALGVPLVFEEGVKRPYVDWEKLEELLKAMWLI